MTLDVSQSDLMLLLLALRRMRFKDPKDAIPFDAMALALEEALAKIDSVALSLVA